MQDGNGNPIPIPVEDRRSYSLNDDFSIKGILQSETTGPDRIAEFSQRGAPGASATIFAPGAFILSTVPGGYESWPGTSMAAPMVSGSVALIQEAALQFGGRLLSVPELRSIVLTSADNILDGDDEDVNVIRPGEGVFDYPGTGNMYKRINVHNAVKAVRAMFAPRQDANGLLEQAITGPLLKPTNAGALSPIEESSRNSMARPSLMARSVATHSRRQGPGAESRRPGMSVQRMWMSTSSW